MHNVNESPRKHREAREPTQKEFEQRRHSEDVYDDRYTEDGGDETRGEERITRARRVG